MALVLRACRDTASGVVVESRGGWMGHCKAVEAEVEAEVEGEVEAVEAEAEMLRAVSARLRTVWWSRVGVGGWGIMRRWRWRHWVHT